jgi:hypothetical protein
MPTPRPAQTASSPCAAADPPKESSGVARATQPAKEPSRSNDSIDAIDHVDPVVIHVSNVNEVTISHHPMNEAETRAEHIDPALTAADSGGVSVKSEGGNQHSFQQQAAGVSRLCAVPLHQHRRGGT